MNKNIQNFYIKAFFHYFCVIAILLSASFGAGGLVLCVEADGGIKVEQADGSGRCAPCTGSTESSGINSYSMSDCVDVVLSSGHLGRTETAQTSLAKVNWALSTSLFVRAVEFQKPISSHIKSNYNNPFEISPLKRTGILLI